MIKLVQMLNEERKNCQWKVNEEYLKVLFVGEKVNISVFKNFRFRKEERLYYFCF